MDKRFSNWELFITFLRIGFFTFGGGLAMIPLIEEEIVKKGALITEDEFIDIIAMVQSLPGAIAINMAGAIGVKLNGIIGAASAYLGVILPSFISIYIIARFFTSAISNDIVVSFFKGLKPGVVALIIVSAWRMKRIILKNGFSIIIGLFSLTALLYYGIDPIVILLASGFLGFTLLRGKIDEYNN